MATATWMDRTSRGLRGHSMSFPGQRRWDAAADLNDDGRVDLFDLMIVLHDLTNRSCR